MKNDSHWDECITVAAYLFIAMHILIKKNDSGNGSWETALMKSATSGLLQSPNVKDAPEVSWKCLQKCK